MKFKNVSPLGALDVPALGAIVDEGEEFDVPERVAPFIAGQAGNFEPVDQEAKDLAEKLAAPEPEPEPEVPTADAASGEKVSAPAVTTATKKGASA